MSLSRVRGSLKIYFFVFYDVVTCEHGEDGMGGLVRTEYACTHINIYIYMQYIHIHIHTMVCVCVCVCLCVYTHTHTHMHTQTAFWWTGATWTGATFKPCFHSLHNRIHKFPCDTDPPPAPFTVAYRISKLHVILIPHPLLSFLPFLPSPSLSPLSYPSPSLFSLSRCILLILLLLLLLNDDDDDYNNNNNNNHPSPCIPAGTQGLEYLVWYLSSYPASCMSATEPTRTSTVNTGICARAPEKCHLRYFRMCLGYWLFRISGKSQS